MLELLILNRLAEVVPEDATRVVSWGTQNDVSEPYVVLGIMGSVHFVAVEDFGSQCFDLAGGSPIATWKVEFASSVGVCKFWSAVCLNC